MYLSCSDQTLVSGTYVCADNRAACMLQYTERSSASACSVVYTVQTAQSLVISHLVRMLQFIDTQVSGL